MAEYNEYSPEEVIVIWGAVQFDGFADGEFVTIELDEDEFTKKAGARGDIVRTENLNKGGNVKVITQAESAVNDLIMLQIATKRAYPLTVKYANGTTLVAGPHCWCKKRPPVAYGKESGNREWMLDVAEFTTYHVGGNNSL